MGCAIAIPEKQRILAERAFSSARYSTVYPHSSTPSRTHPPRRRCGCKARKCPESARTLAAEQLSSHGTVALVYSAPRWSLYRARTDFAGPIHTATRAVALRKNYAGHKVRPAARRSNFYRSKVTFRSLPYAPPRAYSFYSSNFSPRVSLTNPRS